MIARMFHPGNYFCKSCLDEKYIKYFQCVCPALQGYGLKCLRSIPLINLIRFVKITGWERSENLFE